MSTEHNKLIAEFMGYETGLKDGKVLIRVSDLCFEEIDYHNWDKLMPVVEKIMDICYEEDSEGIYVDQDLIEKFLKIRDTIPEIHNTYKAVVEFIKWYNNDQKRVN